jgi:hypothetical protein
MKYHGLALRYLPPPALSTCELGQPNPCTGPQRALRASGVFGFGGPVARAWEHAARAKRLLASFRSQGRRWTVQRAGLLPEGIINPAMRASFLRRTTGQTSTNLLNHILRSHRPEGISTKLLLEPNVTFASPNAKDEGWPELLLDGPGVVFAINRDCPEFLAHGQPPSLPDYKRIPRECLMRRHDQTTRPNTTEPVVLITG